MNGEELNQKKIYSVIFIAITLLSAFSIIFSQTLIKKGIFFNDENANDIVAQYAKNNPAISNGSAYLSKCVFNKNKLVAISDSHSFSKDQLAQRWSNPLNDDDLSTKVIFEPNFDSESYNDGLSGIRAASMTFQNLDYDQSYWSHYTSDGNTYSYEKNLVNSTLYQDNGILNKVFSEWNLGYLLTSRGNMGLTINVNYRYDNSQEIRRESVFCRIYLESWKIAQVEWEGARQVYYYCNYPIDIRISYLDRNGNPQITDWKNAISENTPRYSTHMTTYFDIFQVFEGESGVNNVRNNMGFFSDMNQISIEMRGREVDGQIGLPRVFIDNIYYAVNYYKRLYYDREVVIDMPLKNVTSPYQFRYIKINYNGESITQTNDFIQIGLYNSLWKRYDNIKVNEETGIDFYWSMRDSKLQFKIYGDQDLTSSYISLDQATIVVNTFQVEIGWERVKIIPSDLIIFPQENLLPRVGWKFSIDADFYNETDKGILKEWYYPKEVKIFGIQNNYELQAITLDSRNGMEFDEGLQDAHWNTASPILEYTGDYFYESAQEYEDSNFALQARKFEIYLTQLPSQPKSFFAWFFTDNIFQSMNHFALNEGKPYASKIYDTKYPIFYNISCNKTLKDWSYINQDNLDANPELYEDITNIDFSITEENIADFERSVLESLYKRVEQVDAFVIQGSKSYRIPSRLISSLFGEGNLLIQSIKNELFLTEDAKVFVLFKNNQNLTTQAGYLFFTHLFKTSDASFKSKNVFVNETHIRYYGQVQGNSKVFVNGSVIITLLETNTFQSSEPYFYSLNTLMDTNFYIMNLSVDSLMLTPSGDGIKQANTFKLGLKNDAGSIKQYKLLTKILPLLENDSITNDSYYIGMTMSEININPNSEMIYEFDASLWDQGNIYQGYGAYKIKFSLLEYTDESHCYTNLTIENPCLFVSSRVGKVVLQQRYNMTTTNTTMDWVFEYPKIYPDATMVTIIFMDENRISLDKEYEYYLGGCHTPIIEDITSPLGDISVIEPLTISGKVYDVDGDLKSVKYRLRFWLSPEYYNSSLDPDGNGIYDADWETASKITMDEWGITYGQDIIDNMKQYQYYQIIPSSERYILEFRAEDNLVNIDSKVFYFQYNPQIPLSVVQGDWDFTQYSPQGLFVLKTFANFSLYNTNVNTNDYAIGRIDLHSSVLYAPRRFQLTLPEEFSDATDYLAYQRYVYSGYYSNMSKISMHEFESTIMNGKISEWDFPFSDHYPVTRILFHYDTPLFELDGVPKQTTNIGGQTVNEYLLKLSSDHLFYKINATFDSQLYMKNYTWKAYVKKGNSFVALDPKMFNFSVTTSLLESPIVLLQIANISKKEVFTFKFIATEILTAKFDSSGIIYGITIAIIPFILWLALYYKSDGEASSRNWYIKYGKSGFYLIWSMIWIGLFTASIVASYLIF